MNPPNSKKDRMPSRCAVCGGKVQPVMLAEWTRPTKPEVVIRDISCSECQQCQERYLNSEQVKAVEKKTNEALRQAQGYLSGTEVSAILTMLEENGFTVARLAQVMGVSRQEIYHWLNGERVQSPMADSYLRFIAAQPTQYTEYARERHHAFAQQRKRGRPKKASA